MAVIEYSYSLNYPISDNALVRWKPEFPNQSVD
jgi:hypothetical protein